jgi:hypothetical protein
VFRIRWLSDPPADPGPAHEHLTQRLLRLRNLTMDARADRIPGTAVDHPALDGKVS